MAADVFWAFLAWYLFGGATVGSGAILTSAGVADLQEQVTVVVTDRTRREDALSVLEGLEKDVRAFEKSFQKTGKQLNKLYIEHADNRATARSILAGLSSEWADGQDRALDARFALRDQLTEDEWEALFGDNGVGIR